MPAGRKSQVRYYASRGAYFTTFKGRQHKLAEGPDDAPGGPTYLNALKAFGDLMRIGNAPVAKDSNTFRVIAELYTQAVERRRRPGDSGRSLALTVRLLGSAVQAFGDTRIEDLIPLHIQKWLDDCSRAKRVESPTGKVRTTSWGPSYRGIAYHRVAGALNWAKRQRLISGHCLEGGGVVEIGDQRPRGAECVISDETHRRLVELASPNYKDILIFLHDTGCRPNELFNAEARYYRPDLKAIVYPGRPRPGEFCWKNARKTKRDRTIYLTDRLVEIVERRCKLYPTGPIFRTRYKTKIRAETLYQGLMYLCEPHRLNIQPVPMPYGYRHKYATDWLLGGGSIKVLADLLGTSVEMIERVYGHTDIDPSRMRAMMLERMGNRG